MGVGEEILRGGTKETCVVCLGASAAGFQTLTALLAQIPRRLGYSFVIVHHQRSDGKPMLFRILPRHTKMPVILASDGCCRIQSRLCYSSESGRPDIEWFTMVDSAIEGVRRAERHIDFS